MCGRHRGTRGIRQEQGELPYVGRRYAQIAMNRHAFSGQDNQLPVLLLNMTDGVGREI